MSKKTNKFLVIVLSFVVVLGGILGVSLIKRIGKLETTETVGTLFTYEIGKLNDNTGRGYKKADIADVDDYYAWMHLKNYINADGLTCELAENAKVRYQINFYDENYQFLEVATMTEDYDGSENPIGAKFAIIEISPTAYPDGEIQSDEVIKYAKMLTVTYAKESK